jgi:hypothetical protein
VGIDDEEDIETEGNREKFALMHGLRTKGWRNEKQRAHE